MSDNCQTRDGIEMGIAAGGIGYHDEQCLHTCKHLGIHYEEENGEFIKRAIKAERPLSHAILRKK